MLKIEHKTFIVHVLQVLCCHHQYCQRFFSLAVVVSLPLNLPRCSLLYKKSSVTKLVSRGQPSWLPNRPKPGQKLPVGNSITQNPGSRLKLPDSNLDRPQPMGLKPHSLNRQAACLPPVDAQEGSIRNRLTFSLLLLQDPSLLRGSQETGSASVVWKEGSRPFLYQNLPGSQWTCNTSMEWPESHIVFRVSWDSPQNYVQFLYRLLGHSAKFHFCTGIRLLGQSRQC